MNFITPEDHDLNLVYDGNGNIVELRDNDSSNALLVTLAYTPDNRLKKVIYDPDSAATTVGQYKYDAFGRRVSKQAYDDEVVKFAYDLSGNMIYEFETSGDYLYKEYIYINGHRVLMIAPDGAGQLGGCATADGLEFRLGVAVGRGGHLIGIEAAAGRAGPVGARRDGCVWGCRPPREGAERVDGV